MVYRVCAEVAVKSAVSLGSSGADVVMLDVEVRWCWVWILWCYSGGDGL